LSKLVSPLLASTWTSPSIGWSRLALNPLNPLNLLNPLNRLLGLFDIGDIPKPSVELFCRNLAAWEQTYPEAQRKDTQ
jgi:hypothetical protein